MYFIRNLAEAHSNKKFLNLSGYLASFLSQKGVYSIYIYMLHKKPYGGPSNKKFLNLSGDFIT